MGRFLELVQKIVLERLNFLTKFQYQQEVSLVTNQSGSLQEIQNAEKVLMALLKEWGEVIIGGDLLTVERIDQNKNLRSSNLTEFSRGSFIGPSRIAVFHFRQNIILKLYAVLMPNLHDSSNPGSLNAFRALTDKAKDLSNQERKIKENFELHYQFLMTIAEAFVEEKIFSYAKEKYEICNVKEFGNFFKGKSADDVNALLTEILESSSHTVFFEPNVTLERFSEAVDSDDLQQTGDLFVSVWFMLKSLEFITKTGDPYGIEYFKKNAILLTLSLHSTASKYVHKGFQEMLKVKCMSERERLRFNSGSFIKYHGKQSTGSCLRPRDLNNRSEDMVCEWLVGEVKESLRSMGGNYTEDTIDKKMRATSLVNELLENDNNSLLIAGSGPGSSWERFDEDEVDRFRKYVHKLDPFRYEIFTQLRNLEMECNIIID